MISLIFCSCNKNEPDLEIELPIISVFIPATIEFDKNELDQSERQEIMQLVNNQHIINDVSELPKDPFGPNEAFNNINFNEQTLLIAYHFKSWTLQTFSTRFYKNTQENTYNWVLRLGTTADSDYEPDNILHLTRFAIVVRKLPNNADVKTWYSLTSLVNPLY